MVRKKLISYLQKNDGQELVEFALTLPILAMLVFGIFDLGRVVYYFSVMNNSAREGARYGVVRPWEIDDVTTKTKERSFGMNQDDLSVTVEYSCDYVKVIVGYFFNPTTPFVDDIPLTTSSHLQREMWDTSIASDKTCVPGL